MPSIPSGQLSQGDLLLMPNPHGHPPYILCLAGPLYQGRVMLDFLLCLPSVPTAYFVRDQEYPGRELWLHDDLRHDHDPPVSS